MFQNQREQLEYSETPDDANPDKRPSSVLLWVALGSLTVSLAVPTSYGRNENV